MAVTELGRANRVHEAEAGPVGGDSERADRMAQGVHIPKPAGGVDEAQVEAGAPVEAGGESVAEVGQPAAASVRIPGVETLTQGPGEKRIARRLQPTGDDLSRKAG